MTSDYCWKMSTVVLQVLIVLATGTSCVPLEGNPIVVHVMSSISLSLSNTVLRQPTEYISFQSNVFTEGGYDVDQGIGSCTASKEEVEGINVTVITNLSSRRTTDRWNKTDTPGILFI